MKRICLLLLVLLPVLHLSAQRVMELKIKPLAPVLYNNYQVEFEWIPQKRVGVELKYRYDHKNVSFQEYDFGGGVPVYNTISYKEQLSTFAMAAKYYISNTANGFGPFVGVFCLNQRYYKQARAAQDYYKKIFLIDLPKDRHSALGILAGLKLVYNNLLVFEVAAGFGRNLYNVGANNIFPSGNPENVEFTGFSDLKLGIRIPGKQKAGKK